MKTTTRALRARLSLTAASTLLFVAADPECKSDADCATRVGEKKCDVASGSCSCESDQACVDGYKATGATFSYKCTK